MFRALFDLETHPDPHPNKKYRDRVFVSETWNDNLVFVDGIQAMFGDSVANVHGLCSRERINLII